MAPVEGVRIQVVLSTVDDESKARELARLWVESGRAACVSIVPGVRSVYRWQGAVHDDAELLLVIKTAFTTPEQGERLLASFRRDHPYEQPELLVLEPAAAEAGYARWLLEQVRCDETG